MYEIPLGALDYRDPWDVPLPDRIRMFRSEDVKVAYYYRQADNSTFRYRCFNTALALNAHAPGVSASWFHEKDGERLLALMREADVLVIGRVMYSDQVAQLAAVARRFGAQVFYDVDDYVFDISMIPEIVTTLDQYDGVPESAEPMWNSWFGYAGRYRQTMELADEIIVTNEYLAARTREVVDKTVRIVPNFMGAEQIEYSKMLVSARESAGNRSNGAFHLGYFSGTPTHNRDFAIVAGALARLMGRNEAVRLRLVGFLELKGSLLSEYQHRIDVVPLTNYMDLQRLIAETEVNVAPLQDNRFTNCKSELKYFDAAAVAIPTLASPTFTMSEAIRHGENGLLVRVDEWDENLERVVESYQSEGVAMGKVAFGDALARYCPEAMVGKVLSALGLRSDIAA
jgi:glycosyltransferase involved in cell wall biosynthesis